MKNIIAFIATESRKATHLAVQEFEKRLKQHEDVEFEYVYLSDYRLEFCKGCRLCIYKGEELCPLRDDRDILIEKIERSDGIVFATPNYSFQLSARLKNFLDRTAYVYHRPRYFGKTVTAIVAQGFFGGNKIRKYLEFIGKNYGFQSTKGCVVSGLEPMTELRRKKLAGAAGKAADRFYKGLTLKPAPSLSRLMLFRISRTTLRLSGQGLRDYSYYHDKGWFESGYYYDASLGLIKKAAGRFFDFVGRRVAKLM